MEAIKLSLNQYTTTCSLQLTGSWLCILGQRHTTCSSIVQLCMSQISLWDWPLPPPFFHTYTHTYIHTHSALATLMTDPYGNYVLQTSLDYAPPGMKRTLLYKIRPYLDTAKTYFMSKHLVTKVERLMAKSGPLWWKRRTQLSAYGIYLHGKVIPFTCIRGCTISARKALHQCGLPIPYMCCYITSEVTPPKGTYLTVYTHACVWHHLAV